MAPQTLKLPDWFKEARQEPCLTGDGSKGQGFVEKSLGNIASFMKGLLDCEERASRPGLLQGVDPRARIAGLLALVSACAFATGAAALGLIAAMLIILTILSRVPLSALFKRVLPSFIFTFAIIVPALFSFVSPGKEVLRLWEGVAVTAEGFYYGAFFLLRVSTMVGITALLLLTTRQTDFFKGLRQLPVPSLFVTALFMTFRYVFILVKVAEDAALALKSRSITSTRLRDSQRWAASRITLILKRSLGTAEDVNMAMASRGFDGRVKTFDNGRMRGKDYLWLGFSFFVLLLSLGL